MESKKVNEPSQVKSSIVLKVQACLFIYYFFKNKPSLSSLYIKQDLLIFLSSKLKLVH